MTFLPTEEQRAFTRSLDAMLTASDTPAVARAWAGDDPGPGRALWGRLAEAGVFALAVPEAYEGAGPLPVELAYAFVELGRHVVPGPVVETVATAALLAGLARRGEEGPGKRLLPALASGGHMATLSLAPPGTARPPRLLDADRADLVFVVRDRALLLTPAPERSLPSTDPTRHLSHPTPTGRLLAEGPSVTAAAHRARRWAMLATAAQSLGVGLALLDRTVEYALIRSQFGAPIGSFQAVKHRLADTLLSLEFARPLLFGAAAALAEAEEGGGGPAVDGELAAAKVAAGEAGYAAARTALQIHGAIGYTEELDLSWWLRKARPLRDAWGDPASCRRTVLEGYPDTGP
ncbi:MULTISPECIES: acyl-CoA dehydrogenase family protein [unclassified Streptomyces]|uniref:acyl-CoA dehydrogenase family protein n=1 Tax=unclassified Streptomyces TaxID=2593676 RepID=UPI0016604DAE|nr:MULTISPECIES: acyl-CoA dehydrogenase family protein [unclassified Streptomyces]MBD0711864.1 acyl-CoA dehydrogenase [Streptomyces sp. CBMA291]MBD0717653.1 acyl-CoA dehydrogenase [Streptomyces sp. CBMA370]